MDIILEFTSVCPVICRCWCCRLASITCNQVMTELCNQSARWKSSLASSLTYALPKKNKIKAATLPPGLVLVPEALEQVAGGS